MAKCFPKNVYIYAKSFLNLYIAQCIEIQNYK